MIPDRNDYDPMLGAWLASGYRVEDVVDWLRHGATVAVDTETPGKEDAFTLKAFTAAWHRSDGDIQAIVLDPAHRPADHALAREIIERAGELVMHNSNFDVIGLTANKLMTIDDVAKVSDTLVYARMAFPDTLQRKTLEALSIRLLRMGDLAGGMERAFKAAGFKTIAAGYAGMTVDYPIYRFGAMADTVATLRLLPVIQEEIVRQLTDHPFVDYGITTRAGADAMAEREQLVNRVMLRRSARGLAVDLEYLERYAESVAGEVAKAEAILHGAGIRPGNGQDLVTVLDAAEVGGLPANWPRTATGKLSATKGNLEALAHPLADAHRAVAHSTKILGYLEKVRDNSRHTGRLHPRVNVLGASATGRMSYGEPELQQFSAEARPIICDDGQGLTSIDWSQIEPVTLANMAGDAAFLAPFEGGADLYEPIMRAAGVSRKIAKVVLLATMYGQGVTKLAATIGHTMDSAAQIQRQMLAAMPKSAKFMARIATVASTYGVVPTVSGRILSVPSYNGEYMAYKAVNYVVQGSAYDVLAESIVAAERAGIADHLQLAMHDELVVDTSHAAAFREIMLTPPPALVAWAKRVPVLRTDRFDMEHMWYDPEHPPTFHPAFSPAAS